MYNMNWCKLDLAILENYKPEYFGRMYYPNCCNYCFSSDNLLKCASCKAVSYCSKKHQIEDWSFHKPTCNALKVIKTKVPFPRNHDSKSFFEYRTSLTNQLAKFRSLGHRNLLSEYEKQICMLPWVCMLCFKKPSMKFQCEKCQCVAYCSEQHKKMDYEDHSIYCWPWKLCRTFNSLHFVNGYVIKAAPYVYHPIKRNIKRWPKDKLQLCDLIQNTDFVYENMDFDSYINATVFIDSYIPAAIIINVFEKANLIKKRQLTTKLEMPRLSCLGQQRGLLMTKKEKFKLKKKKTTMTIHFAIADDTELSFDWNDIARLLTNWIINIQNVEIVITGSNLKNPIIPQKYFSENVEVIIHKKSYQEVDDLSEPDVVVLLECERIFGLDRDGILNEEKHKNVFFRYPNVPVIFCDGHPHVVSQISKFFSKFNDIKCIVPIHTNPFTDMTMTRIWNRNMTTFVKNGECVVFKKY